MTSKEAKELEDKLSRLFEYKRNDRCQTANEDYGMSKSVRDEHYNLLYIIEYRFWDYRKHEYALHNEECAFGVDIAIVIVDVKERADAMLMYPRMSVEKVEHFAKQYYKLCKSFNL